MSPITAHEFNIYIDVAILTHQVMKSKIPGEPHR